jgi:hypothetical protein
MSLKSIATKKAYKIIFEGSSYIKILKSQDINIILGNTILLENLKTIALTYKTVIEHYKKSRNLSIKNYNIGTIYYLVKKYDKMKKYYLKKPNQSYAINNLGYYYRNIEKSDKNAIQYFSQAMILGNFCAYVNLEKYYKDIEEQARLKYYIDGIKLGSKYAARSMAYYYYENRNYDLMKKYYEIGITMDCSKSAYELGIYYRDDEKNYDLMKKYYEIGITMDCSMSAYELGSYYQDDEKNYDLMKKYYEIGIELGNFNSANNLGYYYQCNEKNYDLMKKYYEIGIKLGNSSSAYNLGSYYQDDEKNYDLMKKYYEIGIELGDSTSANDLGYYYDQNENNYDLMKKYYEIGIALGNSSSAYNLGSYYQDEKNYSLMKKYYEIGIKLNCGKCASKLSKYYNIIENNNDMAIQYCILAINLGNLQEIKYFNRLCIEKKTFATTFYLEYIEKFGIVNLVDKCVKLHIHEEHCDAITQLVNNFPIEYVEYVFKSIAYIDNTVLVKVLDKIVETEWNLDNSYIVKYINSLKDFNILNRFKSLLVNNNAVKVDKIIKLSVVGEECGICSVMPMCVIFKCHDKHIVCVNCAYKLDKCPYCRSKFYL